MSISDNIKRLRNYYNLTQSELGKIAGVSDKAVSTWENGTAEPRMGALQKICDYYHISTGMLIEGYSIQPAETSEELELLRLFKKLNQSGKYQLLDYAEFLTRNPRLIECDNENLIKSV